MLPTRDRASQNVLLVQFAPAVFLLLHHHALLQLLVPICFPLVYEWVDQLAVHFHS